MFLPLWQIGPKESEQEQYQQAFEVMGAKCRGLCYRTTQEELPKLSPEQAREYLTVTAEAKKNLDAIAAKLAEIADEGSADAA